MIFNDRYPVTDSYFCLVGIFSRSHKSPLNQMDNIIFFVILPFFFFFFKSLLVACPTHTNPPGSGLGTGGIVFDKHIDKSTQQMNLKVHNSSQ